MSRDVTVKLKEIYIEDENIYGVTSTDDLLARDNKARKYLRSQITLESATQSKLRAEFPLVSNHCVYKVKDLKGSILYIGKSSNGRVASRLRTHFGSQKTFEGYSEVEIWLAVFSNEADCLIYEQYLIALENPPLNKDKPTRRSYLDLREPYFEYYTTIKTINEVVYEDKNTLAKKKYNNINRYCKSQGKICITFEDYLTMVDTLNVDLNSSGSTRGSLWRFDYNLMKYVKRI